MPGAVALVGRNGRIVREEAYGLADVENEVPFNVTGFTFTASKG